jgi:hypothetical protein
MTSNDMQYQISESLDRWPNATPETVERIARKAQQVAEETEQQGIEEGRAYGACQSEYGCDWQWDESADEPTARVFDCDGFTITTITGADR